jgi:8-oxo-dGTP pyrophosphatase MutT (NUDIX family)
MELNSEVVTTPPRDAATVVMLRDTPKGLEVFLVKRHGLSDVLGGAYVFPGGKLDDSDSKLDPQAHLDQAPEHLHKALGESDTHVNIATGLYVAALREAFEESGVLFAHHANTATLADTARAAQLQRDALPFNQILAQMALRLQTQSVLPWSRWITPIMPSVSSKRFDTRFFVAAIPPDQVASHDNHETTESAWLPPRTALEQYRDGQIELAPPQIMSLAHLARHNTVDSVMSAARATPPPVIQPEAFDDAGERVICYPGDPRHSVLARALPGPTRLRYRNRRFEPMDGFEALFG